MKSPMSKYLPWLRSEAKETIQGIRLLRKEKKVGKELIEKISWLKWVRERHSEVCGCGKGKLW